MHTDDIKTDKSGKSRNLRARLVFCQAEQYFCPASAEFYSRQSGHHCGLVPVSRLTNDLGSLPSANPNYGSVQTKVVVTERAQKDTCCKVCSSVISTVADIEVGINGYLEV